MRRVTPCAEPATFDARCRSRGRKWLSNHPTYDRPNDYWSEFQPALHDAFNGLCGYCAMVTMQGQVDHFVPVARLKKLKRDAEAYEWSNLRYAAGSINQRKLDRRVLDPFQVQDSWFEVQLPSMQLLLTASVPKSRRKLAEFTLERLGLRDGEVVVRFRTKWFELYRDRKLTIDGLREVAPLIAAAVERELAAGTDWRR